MRRKYLRKEVYYVRFNLDGRTCINSNDEVEMFPGNALIAAYDENDNIKDLIIRDNKNNIRFSKLSKDW